MVNVKNVIVMEVTKMKSIKDFLKELKEEREILIFENEEILIKQKLELEFINQLLNKEVNR